MSEQLTSKPLIRPGSGNPKDAVNPRAARRRHVARLLSGLAFWALVTVDATTNLVRDPLRNVDHPLAAAAVPLALLLIGTALLWTRPLATAALDLLVVAAAPLIVLTWHLPRALFRMDNFGPVGHYLNVLVAIAAHARSLVTFTLLFIVGSSTLALSTPVWSFLGGLVLAGSMFFLVWRLAARMLNPSRMFGVQIKTGHRILTSKVVDEALFNPGNTTPRNRTEGVLAAVAGLALNRLYVQLLLGIQRRTHVLLISAHLLATYLLLLIAFTALNLGIYYTWPGSFLTTHEPTLLHFFAFTVFSIFNADGSGITSNGLGPGFVQVTSILCLGSVSVAGVVSLVQSVRGRYETQARETVKELKDSFKDFDKRFRTVFGSPLQEYMARLRAESSDLAALLTAFVRLLGDFSTVEQDIPTNRAARRKGRK